MDNRHPPGDDKENRSVRRAMLERQAAEDQKKRLEDGDFDNDASPAGKSAAKRAAESLEDDKGTRERRQREAALPPRTPETKKKK